MKIRIFRQTLVLAASLVLTPTVAASREGPPGIRNVVPVHDARVGRDAAGTEEGRRRDRSDRLRICEGCRDRQASGAPIASRRGGRRQTA